MDVRALHCLPLAALCAAGLAAPAGAVPLPQPRPAHLKVAAPVPAPIPVPQPAVPAPAAAPAPAPAPSPAPVVAAPAAPVTPAESPAPAASAEPPVAAAPAETSEPVATAAVPAEPAAPTDLGAPVDIGPAPGAETAATGEPVPDSTLKKVNSYFNGIRTLVGNFTQIGPDGSRADGKFFLMKPGKVRFYYQRPSTTDIIADGKSLVVRDRKLATQDVYPLSQTPLRFLLDNNLDLARDSKVVGLYEEPGLISVAIEEETTFGGKARVLIVFAAKDDNTFELKQWTITDPQGLDTTVSVSELDTATRPDDKLFAVDYTRYVR